MAARLVYMTAGNIEEATKLGRALVEEGLAACINILPGMTSLYWWQDNLQHDEELVVLAKTAADKVEALTARVRELHSYDCPCVVAVPIEGGNPEFLRWIESETAGGTRRRG
jgi:periplasmic divalent cation tolerance protein